MTSRVVPGNKVPLYRQVARDMMQRIRTGDYRAGEPLSPIRAISDEFNVSVNVVQRAIHVLERDGLVRSQHGKQVMVTTAEGAKRAALVFGLIHPYAEGMAFGRDVLHFAGRAFSERHNLLVTVSSDGLAAKERERAEHLLNNGVRGLLVWPVASDDNAAFFAELTRKVPVVLVDRLIPGASLPAVIHDTHAAGRDICEYFFGRCGKKRLLVVMDDLDISPYHDMVRGMRAQAQAMDRMTDLTVIQLPISELVRQFNQGDFSSVDHYAEYIERLVHEGGYDAMFCYQEEFLDYVIVDNGLLDRLDHLSLGATRSVDINIRSRRYVQAAPAIWQIDHVGAISAAADRLQEIVLSKRPFNEVVTVPLVRTQPS